MMAVEDNFNSYFTQVLSELQASYPEIKGSTVYKRTPASFPYMYFKQIDGSTALTTLSRTEDGINLGIQLEIYCTDSAANTRKMANIARATMLNLGFLCRYYEPMENAEDTSIFRFVGRYEKLET